MANKDKQTETTCARDEANSQNKTDYSPANERQMSSTDGSKLHKSKSENDKVLSDNASSHSRSNKSLASSAAAKGSTKVYYHIDDEPTPYCTEVPVPSDQITLADFKAVLNRTNFKFYCKANDPEVGGEVKAEIRDEQQRLYKSTNGQFELFLLTAEGSSHSDGASSASFSKIAAIKRTVPAPAPLYPLSNSHIYRPRYHLDAHFSNRRRPLEDSTIYTTETEGRIYSDDESRVSTSTDNITSVSRQHYGMYRRRKRQQFHRNRRQPSRASSLSSMTETSMALDVITVTLNMDTVNFLGISIVGQSSSRGDNGIYVANVMPGGAVALDGRIEPGDMILQVNDISFENFKNDQAVDVLKRAVNTRGPIKLTVAKSFDAVKTNCFAVPSREPVRPIDTQAWVQHTNAVRGMTGTLVMNAIPEGSEGTPTPIPGQYPPGSIVMHTFPDPSATTMPNPNQRPGSSSTSNGSGGAGAAQTIVGPRGKIMAMNAVPRLDVHTDKRKVMQALTMPNSGLDIRDRTWLKIPIPMSFLGRSLIDWLVTNVDGLKDRKEARRYASELLHERLIAHVVNKESFTEQCYYIFGEESHELLNMRKTYGENGGNNGLANAQQQFQQMQIVNDSGILYANRAHQQPQYIQQTNFGGGGGNSMVSEYASMPPVSPYPLSNIHPMKNVMINANYAQRQQHQQQTFVQPPFPSGNPIALQRVVAASNEQFGATSQASNNSNEESSGSEQRRIAILPPAPSLNSVGPSNPPPPFSTHQQFPQHPRQLPPSGAPPSTPIGDDGQQQQQKRLMMGGGGQQAAGMQQQAPAAGRIRLSDNFPEVFVEHF